MKRELQLLACSLACFSSSTFALAQISIGTTDASDGDFTGSYWGDTLDLSAAPTGVWDQPSPIPGRGVYDPQKWAVVYKFNNVSSRGFSFIGHPSGCPVVILCQGNFSVTQNAVSVPPLVGSFLGGLASGTGFGSAGLGLGGGQTSTNSNGPGQGSYATAGIPSHLSNFPAGDPYGNPAIIPLVGGSGGGGYYNTPGQSGGGAILIAARNTVTLNSPVQAGGYGGNNIAPGAGGAIRIIGNVVTGNGSVHTASPGSGNWGTGGQGRIRIEANTFGTWGSGQPNPSLATVGTTAKIWPSNTDPNVSVLSVNSIPAPLDPGAVFQSPDIQLSSAGSFSVVLECRNVPTDGTWSVTVRGVPRSGAATVYPCTLVNGNQALSTWIATVPFTEGLQVVQGRAKKNSGGRPGR